jgi:hypothetical protein
MYYNDNDELAYLWTKIKFVQNYMSKNKNSTLDDAEREFHNWVEGLMDSRIEQANKILNASSNSTTYKNKYQNADG